MDTTATPRADRRPADRPSTLRGEAGAPLDAWVHDVSTTGMRIQCLADLRIGEAVSIGLSGAGLTQARIVWRKGQEYGCAFLEPLEDADASLAFKGSSVVRLGQFGGASDVDAPASPGIAAVMPVSGGSARGRFWMAGLLGALLAVAAPASIFLSRALL